MTTKLITAFLLILSCQAFSQETKGMDAKGMDAMAFMIGEWDFAYQYRKQDGTFGDGAAISKVTYILDGQSIQDTYGEVHNGKYIPFGNTIRSYDNRTRKYRMLWYNASLSDYTLFEGKKVDGEFHFEGRGRDQRGEFLEQITFYDIQADSYSWKMNRSYDDGKTWLENFFAYKATRRK